MNSPLSVAACTDYSSETFKQCPSVLPMPDTCSAFTSIHLLSSP